MELSTYFEPNENIYNIRSYEEINPIYKEDKCSICNGEGIINNVFICGNCGGKGKETIRSFGPKSKIWTEYKEIVQIVRSLYKENEYGEYVYRRFFDDTLHNQNDLVHKPLNIRTHGGLIDNLFKNQNDINLLREGKIPEKQKTFRINSKFNFGDKIYSLNLNYKKIEECEKCGGTWSFSYKGYNHYCKYCEGRGEIEKDIKEFTIISGVIEEIRLVQQNENKIIFYSYLEHLGKPWRCIRNDSEEYISYSEEELIKKANDMEFTTRVYNFLKF
jgi:RecJ-like exonuclease